MNVKEVRARDAKETERIRLPFFKGPQDNFLYWSAQIKSTLKSKRVWSVVRDPDAPDTSATQEDTLSLVLYQNNDEKSDTACAIILGPSNRHARYSRIIIGLTQAPNIY